MSGSDARAALERALELSRELVAVARLGDVAAAVNLDASRLELLKSARETVRTTPMDDRELLQEIAQVNAGGIGGRSIIIAARRAIWIWHPSADALFLPTPQPGCSVR